MKLSYEPNSLTLSSEFVKFQNNVDAKSRELLKAAEEAKSESAKRDKELNQKLVRYIKL